MKDNAADRILANHDCLGVIMDNMGHTYSLCNPSYNAGNNNGS